MVRFALKSRRESAAEVNVVMVDAFVATLIPLSTLTTSVWFTFETVLPDN